MSISSVETRDKSFSTAVNSKSQSSQTSIVQSSKAPAPNPAQVSPAVKVQLGSKISEVSANLSKNSNDRDGSNGDKQEEPSNQLSTELETNSSKIDSVA